MQGPPQGGLIDQRESALRHSDLFLNEVLGLAHAANRHSMATLAAAVNLRIGGAQRHPVRMISGRECILSTLRHWSGPTGRGRLLQVAKPQIYYPNATPCACTKKAQLPCDW